MMKGARVIARQNRCRDVEFVAVQRSDLSMRQSAGHRKDAVILLPIRFAPRDLPVDSVRCTTTILIGPRMRCPDIADKQTPITTRRSDINTVAGQLKPR